VLEKRPELQVYRDHLDIAKSGAVLQDVNDRIIGPRRLFMLTSKDSSEMHGYTLATLTDAKERPDFLFVAYTTKQFLQKDHNALHAVAERAARDAGLAAFWCASRCLDQEDPLEVSNSITMNM
jgi:LmbE family N-acetylglucosaminyl deacetylase